MDICNLTELDLLFLRRLVTGNIDVLRRRLDRLARLAPRYPDDTFERKIAIAEAELKSMLSLRDNINTVIAVGNMRDNV